MGVISVTIKLGSNRYAINVRKQFEISLNAIAHSKAAMVSDLTRIQQLANKTFPNHHIQGVAERATESQRS